MSGYKLLSYKPKWASWLGLELDWHSRPADRERTYHSHGRAVELTVGSRGFRWALQKSVYPEYKTLHIACPWLSLYWRIGPGKEPPIGEMAVYWGVYVFEGDLVFEWGTKHARLTLNPFHWKHYASERLRADGEFDGTKSWTTEAKEIEWYSEEHPYAIASVPHYSTYDVGTAEPHFQIETWHARATCYVDRTTRTRRFLPFWRRVQFYVYFDLDDEVGKGKGSWKGGTVGFSEELFPGDGVAEVVSRAAAKGRGR